MARYIDADNIRYHEKENIDGYVYSEVTNRDEIDRIPTEDVKPVIHAKWIKGKHEDTDYSICSNCKSLHNRWVSYRYCPDCGAKMDKEC